MDEIVCGTVLSSFYTVFVFVSESLPPYVNNCGLQTLSQFLSFSVSRVSVI